MPIARLFISAALAFACICAMADEPNTPRKGAPNAPNEGCANYILAEEDFGADVSRALQDDGTSSPAYSDEGGSGAFFQDEGTGGPLNEAEF